jgi:DNA-binding HxlR family transcriptional regulator
VTAEPELDPLVTALEVVGAKWSLRIVDALLVAPKRYGDLQRELGTPTNILATRLAELQAAGVIARILLFHNSRAYTITDRGRALAPAIEALRAWGSDVG